MHSEDAGTQTRFEGGHTFGHRRWMTGAVEAEAARKEARVTCTWKFWRRLNASCPLTVCSSASPSNVHQLVLGLLCIHLTHAHLLSLSSDCRLYTEILLVMIHFKLIYIV